MKKIVLYLSILLASCSVLEQKTSIEIYDLKAAMAYGKIINLNDYNPNTEKDLLVRLYQVPLLNGGCFEETHGVCQNKFYISVSTFDEYPETNVFQLSVVGEVSDVQWIAEQIYDYVEIQLILSKYTKEALENNKKLTNEKLTILLKLDSKNISETSQ